MSNIYRQELRGCKDRNEMKIVVEKITKKEAKWSCLWTMQLQN